MFHGAAVKYEQYERILQELKDNLVTIKRMETMCEDRVHTGFLEFNLSLFKTFKDH